jgi:hypothetical protein
VGVPGGLGGQQCSMQSGPARGQDGDRLVAVVVGGTAADGVVAGQLGHPGVVQEPAQNQDRLRAGTQNSCPGAGSSQDPFRVEQAGEEHRSPFAYRQDSFIGNTHGSAEPQGR